MNDFMTYQYEQFYKEAEKNLETAEKARCVTQTPTKMKTSAAATCVTPQTQTTMATLNNPHGGGSTDSDDSCYPKWESFLDHPYNHADGAMNRGPSTHWD